MTDIKRNMINVIRKIPAFLRLVRWPNLLIIIAIQLALYYFIIERIYTTVGIPASLCNLNLLLLIIATVLVAAAGYIINDYFDIRVDRINKPQSMVLGRIIERRTGIVLHQILSAIAVLIGFYIAYQVESWRLGLIFPMIIMLLWLYSVKYKRTVIWGNVAIAVMAALVILLVWLFEFFMLLKHPDDFITAAPYLGLITRYFGFFASFAFLLTFIREIIKDAEDVDGDKTTGAGTLAVQMGIAFSKKVALLTSVVTALFMLYLVISLLINGMTIAGAYFGTVVFLPLIYLTISIFKAHTKSDFHSISVLLKIIMVAGIIGLQPLAILI